MATISDVAKHAGVGLGTVSRVLNGSSQVRESTRARVLEAIDELDYRPNPLARGLSRGRCQTLGVVVPFFTHASAVERLRGVVAALDESRYDLVLFNVESTVHRDQHLASITGRDRTDGLLVMSLPIPPHDLDRLTAAGVPVVLVDTSAAGVAAVVSDDVAGGRLATEHLIALGHQSIAFIGDDPENPFGFTSTAKRELGYTSALRDAGIAFRAELVRHGAHDREVARDLAAELLAEPRPPTAVFASSDVQAMGVLAAAAERGLSVPRDLSVVGFDDIELAAYIGLSTVHQPLFDSGFLGAQLLLEAVGGQDVPAVEHALPVVLVERTTTAAHLQGAA
jgi:DNA-binding LacI/PurR family transcriptional regulator